MAKKCIAMWNLPGEEDRNIGYRDYKDRPRTRTCGRTATIDSNFGSDGTLVYCPGHGKDAEAHKKNSEAKHVEDKAKKDAEDAEWDKRIKRLRALAIKVKKGVRSWEAEVVELGELVLWFMKDRGL